MSVLDQLRENLSDLSRNERRVADYILNNPQEMRSLSGEALSAICGASRSTVLRLCQKLGYQGYAEFKYALQHETEHPAQARPADALPTQNALTYYCSGMLQMEPLITSDALREFVDALSHANRVVALGLNHSSVSAEQLAFRLNKFGVDCHMLRDDTLMASYERVLKQGDVVVIFSISGRDFYETLVAEYRKNRVKVILITMNPDSELNHAVDISIVLPYLTNNATGMYPMDEAPIFFMFIEILMEALHHKLRQLDV